MRLGMGDRQKGSDDEVEATMAAIAQAAFVRILALIEPSHALFARARRAAVGLLSLLSVSAALGGCTTPALLPAQDPTRPMIVLADSELDSVTAGGMQISLDLITLAHGPTAYTSMSADARILAVKMPLLDPVPLNSAQSAVLGPGRTVWNYRGMHDYYISAGQAQAIASGADAAAASVQLGLVGPILFLRLGAFQTVAPHLATSSVRFFSISAR